VKTFASPFARANTTTYGEIVWNKEVKEIRPLEQGSLKLLFDDSSSADTDLLAGSDGIWSSVRKHIIQQKELDNAELRWQPDFIYADGLYGHLSKGRG
jgi:2-polyprenyl-6-methoxyphenol hydroxylase-like FAD-dependent oxidoreductase